MATVETIRQRGERRGHRALRILADEFRAARISLGLSQDAVARTARISRSRYTRIEGAGITTLSVVEAARVSAVVGLDLVVRTYPGGSPLRDGAHARRLQALGREAVSPLRFRTEVQLPARPDATEQRAWDAELRGHDERTVLELEMRLSDAQAVERRIAAKRRDDPSEHFLLLVADTRHNRRVLTDHPALFPDLPRWRPSVVRAALRSGRHPMSGIVLV